MRRRKGLGGMEIAVLVVIVISWFGWLAVEKDSQNPETDVMWGTERDLRTGEIFNIETVRCRICKQVISCVRFNAQGKATGGFSRNSHNCNRLIAKTQYNTLGLGPKPFNFMEWLDHWQKKLSAIGQ